MTAEPPGRRRRSQQLTATRLESAALWYLQRYASSSANLRQVLERRIARLAVENHTLAAEATSWIDDILAKLTRLGLLDDAAYAAGRVRSLHRQGRSARHIRAKLAEKGVAEEVIAAALAGRSEMAADAELAAACLLARRRRLGPFGADRSCRARDRALAILGRAGFSYGIACRVVDADSADALEADALAAPPER